MKYLVYFNIMELFDEMGAKPQLAEGIGFGHDISAYSPVPMHSSYSIFIHLSYNQDLSIYCRHIFSACMRHCGFGYGSLCFKLFAKPVLGIKEINILINEA